MASSFGQSIVQTSHIVAKSNMIVHFLGRTEDTMICFREYLTFRLVQPENISILCCLFGILEYSYCGIATNRLDYILKTLDNVNETC